MLSKGSHTQRKGKFQKDSNAPNPNGEKRFPFPDFGRGEYVESPIKGDKWRRFYSTTKFLTEQGEEICWAKQAKKELGHKCYSIGMKKDKEGGGSEILKGGSGNRGKENGWKKGRKLMKLAVIWT